MMGNHRNKCIQLLRTYSHSFICAVGKIDSGVLFSFIDSFQKASVMTRDGAMATFLILKDELYIKSNVES